MMDWYVIRTVAVKRVEFDVEHTLIKRGREALVPFWTRRVPARKGGGWEYRKEPCFEAYVFAAFKDIYDFAAEREAINVRAEAFGKIPPIISLCGPKGQPGKLKTEDLHYLRELSGKNRERPAALANIEAGGKAQVTEGPFAGFTGDVERLTRQGVKMWLRILGGW